MDSQILDLIKGFSPGIQTVVLLVWFMWQMQAAKKVEASGTQASGGQAELSAQIAKMQEAVVIELRMLRADIGHALQAQAKHGAYLERLAAIEDKLDRDRAAGT